MIEMVFCELRCRI